MAEQAIRAEDVEELKKLVNGITGSAEDLQSLESIEELVEDMKKDLKRMNSSYWILVYDFEILGNDDFTRFYHPIYFLPRDEAEELAHMLLGEGYYDEWTLKAVEIGEYEKFMVLKKLTALKHHVRELSGYEKYRLNDDVLEDLDSKIKALRAECGLTRRWEVVE